jgi:hypothetical protein
LATADGQCEGSGGKQREQQLVCTAKGITIGVWRDHLFLQEVLFLAGVHEQEAGQAALAA